MIKSKSTQKPLDKLRHPSRAEPAWSALTSTLNRPALAFVHMLLLILIQLFPLCTYQREP